MRNSSKVFLSRRRSFRGWKNHEKYRGVQSTPSVPQGHKHRGHCPLKIPWTPAEPHRTLEETPAEAFKNPSQRQISSESLPCEWRTSGNLEIRERRVVVAPLLRIAPYGETISVTQGALKGTNLRGQTNTKRRFSQIFADSRLFLENKALGNADFRRKPQVFAGNRRFSQENADNRRLAFVPLSSSL